MCKIIIADKLSQYPELEGKRVAFFWLSEDDLGTFYIYTSNDPRAAFLSDLGFVTPDSVKSLITSDQDFSITVSAENADLLTDVDIIITYGTESLVNAMQADGRFANIPAVKRGRFPYQNLFGQLSKADYEAIACAMEAMGIAELADKSVDSLSGGQRQRVWIALVLAQDTDILLLDEPTTYLDIAYQVEILDCLAKLNKLKKTTIVAILHDINLSIRYADHIFAMKKGQLLAEGTPRDIITTDLMKEVYSMESSIITDPETGDPYVIPRSKAG